MIIKKILNNKMKNKKGGKVTIHEEDKHHISSTDINYKIKEDDNLYNKSKLTHDEYVKILKIFGYTNIVDINQLIENKDKEEVIEPYSLRKIEYNDFVNKNIQNLLNK